MDILSKRSMEITALAMDGLASRHKALSSNIANANTPDYSRVDVEFEGQLKKILETEVAKERHQEIKKPLEYSGFNPQIVMSSDPAQIEGMNNVNIEMEMAQLAKNGMKYNALAQLQSKAFNGLKEVIRGGGS